MNKVSQFFKQADEAMFKKIDTLEEDSRFQSFMNRFDAFTEEQQKWIYSLLSIFIILLPLIITSIFFFSNWKYRSALETKEDILKSIYQYTDIKNESSSVSRQIIAPYSLDDRAAFERKVTSIANTSRIPTANLKVSSYKSEAVSEELIKNSGSLEFEKLSTSSLTTLLSTTINRERFKVRELQVSRSSKGTLSGSLSLVHFGRKNEQ